MKIYLLLILSILLSGCYSVASPPLPKDIFQYKTIFEKPEINNLSDVNKAYINLFEAYRKNLSLINTIELMNK